MKRRLAVVAVLALLAAACGGGGAGEDGATSEPSGASQDLTTLSAQIASYETVTDDPNRLLIGLFTPNGVVSYGTVDVTISQDNRSTPPQTARFILVPEESADPPTPEDLQAAENRDPEVTLPIEARGVYQLSDVIFEDPGIYDAAVEVTLADGTTGSISTAFEVIDRGVYPAVGEDAPRTKNLTIADHEDASLAAVDSRADDFGVPDEPLHTGVIADSIEAGRPLVVVVATPQYCRSRFCGPIVDEIGAVQQDYGEVADFVHLEIWRDFQNTVVNRGAAEWVLRGKGGDQQLTEPWIFLVGPDGKIVDRWQNVLDSRELTAYLDQLGGAEAAA